jgi:hypothetical protein
MTKYGCGFKARTWLMAAVLAALTTGCGDGIFGGSGGGAGGPGPAGPGPALGAAATYGFFSGAALTGEGDDPNTRITGDAGTTGAAASVTGFHDGTTSYTEVCPAGIAAVGCGFVTGTITSGGASAAAQAAALNAYSGPGGLSPAARPGGLDVTVNTQAVVGAPAADQLGGRTLAPGIYYSNAAGASASYQITGANDLILDAGGNANAVWVFQMDSTLLVSAPAGPVATIARTVQLIGNAQAKNVFWYVPAGATINTGSNMVGTIISNASTTFGTSTGANPVIITTLNGRALVTGGAGATLVNTHIIVPAP